MRYLNRLSLVVPIAAASIISIGAAPSNATTLNIVMESRVSVLDPVLSTAHQSRNHGYMIYDTLLALDEQGVIRPEMVDNWRVSDDKKTYTFTLRDGLTWHDGAKVTAEDCVASIKRWAQQDRMGRALMKYITDLHADTEKSFSVTLSIQTELILTAFAKPSGIPLFMMPKRVAETPVTVPITDYTGSGPFKFVAAEYKPGVRVVYVKNEAYVPRPEPASGLAGGKVAKVDRVERIEMADQLSAVNALVKHEIDYLETVPFDLLPMVEGLPGVVVERLDTLGYQPVYRFNHLHPPFNNKLVRQAAMYAIGQEAALQTQIGNPKYYRTCAAVFGCGLPYESSAKSEMVIPSNIEKAKSLLKQSGYNGERVVVLQATDIPLIASMPIVIAQHLREAGFNVDLQAMDFMTVLSRRSNRASVADGGWSLFVTTWHNTEVEDPVRSFTVTANGNDAWAGWPTVPAIVEGTNQFLLAPDEEHRKEIAARLQELVIDEGVVGPLGSVTKPVGYSTAISGILHAPVQVFWNISK